MQCIKLQLHSPAAQTNTWSAGGVAAVSRIRPVAKPPGTSRATYLLPFAGAVPRPLSESARRHNSRAAARKVRQPAALPLKLTFGTTPTVLIVSWISSVLSTSQCLARPLVKLLNVAQSGTIVTKIFSAALISPCSAQASTKLPQAPAVLTVS